MANYAADTTYDVWLTFNECNFLNNSGKYLFALTSMSYPNVLYTNNCLFRQNKGGIVSIADKSYYEDSNSTYIGNISNYSELILWRNA